MRELGHLLNREGRAICGAYTVPRHIEPDETICPNCMQIINGLNDMRAGRFRR